MPTIHSPFPRPVPVALMRGLPAGVPVSGAAMLFAGRALFVPAMLFAFTLWMRSAVAHVRSLPVLRVLRVRVPEVLPAA